MKTRLLFAAVCCTALLFSCSKNSDKTIAPGDYVFDVLISIQDIKGNDLLNVENPNNVLSEIELAYKGKVFKVDVSPFYGANPIPEILGLKLYSKAEKNYLWFGNFSYTETDIEELKLKCSGKEISIGVKGDISTLNTTYFVDGKQIFGQIVLVF